MPVFCGSAFKNKGVQPLLDGVVDFLPAPTDVPAVSGTLPDSDKVEVRESTDAAPLSALAFKIMTDPFVGSLTFVRVYSGVMNSGSQVFNSVRGQRERIGRMLQMHSNHREDVKEAHAGDIVAIAGLKSTTTGETLCDPAKPIILERMVFPDPVIEVAVEPKTKSDQEKMGVALSRLAQEDPSFRVASDPESGQTIIKGMGELHLDIIVDRMRREFKVEANVGAPQVAYREAITRSHEIDYTHKKQTGGSGQFARVKIVFEPLETGEGFVFENKVVGGSVPRNTSPAWKRAWTAPARPVCWPVSRDRLQGAARRRCQPRCRLLQPCFRDCDPGGFREGILKCGPVLHGADHEGRGGNAGRIYGRRHRRPEQPARQRAGHG